MTLCAVGVHVQATHPDDSAPCGEPAVRMVTGITDGGDLREFPLCERHLAEAKAEIDRAPKELP